MTSHVTEFCLRCGSKPRSSGDNCRVESLDDPDPNGLVCSSREVLSRCAVSRGSRRFSLNVLRERWMPNPR